MDTQETILTLKQQILELKAELKMFEGLNPYEWQEMQERWQLVLQGTNDGMKTENQ